MGAGQSRVVNRVISEEPSRPSTPRVSPRRLSQAPRASSATVSGQEQSGLPASPRRASISQSTVQASKEVISGQHDDLSDYETDEEGHRANEQRLENRVVVLMNELRGYDERLDWANKQVEIAQDEADWARRSLRMTQYDLLALERVLADRDDFHVGSPRGIPLGSPRAYVAYGRRPRTASSRTSNESQAPPQPRAQSEIARQPRRHTPLRRRAATSEHQTPPLDPFARLDRRTPSLEVALRRQQVCRGHLCDAEDDDVGLEDYVDEDDGTALPLAQGKKRTLSTSQSSSPRKRQQTNSAWKSLSAGKPKPARRRPTAAELNDAAAERSEQADQPEQANQPEQAAPTSSSRSPSKPKPARRRPTAAELNDAAAEQADHTNQAERAVPRSSNRSNATDDSRQSAKERSNDTGAAASPPPSQRMSTGASRSNDTGAASPPASEHISTGTSTRSTRSSARPIPQNTPPARNRRRNTRNVPASQRMTRSYAAQHGIEVPESWEEAPSRRRQDAATNRGRGKKASGSKKDSKKGSKGIRNKGPRK